MVGFVAAAIILGRRLGWVASGNFLILPRGTATRALFVDRKKTKSLGRKIPPRVFLPSLYNKLYWFDRFGEHRSTFFNTDRRKYGLLK